MEAMGIIPIETINVETTCTAGRECLLHLMEVVKTTNISDILTNKGSSLTN